MAGTHQIILIRYDLISSNCSCTHSIVSDNFSMMTAIKQFFASYSESHNLAFYWHLLNSCLLLPPIYQIHLSFWYILATSTMHPVIQSFSLFVYISSLSLLKHCVNDIRHWYMIYVTWSRGMSRMSAILFLRYWQNSVQIPLFYIVFSIEKFFITL